MAEAPISLRPWKPADAPALMEAIAESAGDLGPWSPWWHPSFGEADALVFIEGTIAARPRGEAHELAIIAGTGDEERILGSCGINEIKALHRVANLGYWVRSSETGKGIASAVVRQLAAWVFGNMELNRLELVIATGNPASKTVAEKAGANFEGVQRQRLLLHGTTHDALMYAIYRD
ncbi:MAG: ribosomal-protein-serine acetyltransferase [Bacteroidia bacterium]|jgi:RimJ/RimL family protein N-acetyltransferase